MALSRAMERSTVERALSIGAFIAIGLGSFATGSFLERRFWIGVLGYEPSRVVELIIAIVCGALFTAAAYFVWMQYWRGFLVGAERFRSMTVIAEPSGITFDSGSVQTVSPWNAFSRVHTTADHVFLFFTRRQAFIIPRSAFASRDDEETLLGWARSSSQST